MTAVTKVYGEAARELEVRAGASDADRAAWLVERRTGVTATEIRDLFLKGPSYRRELIALKLGRKVDDFAGNAYTAWGKEREPVIAEIARQRFNMQPESRVFHAVENPRFLASPDGVGFDFDWDVEIAEYKTSGHDVSVGSLKFDEVGYALQMTWAMRVTGARSCLYGSEYRLGSPRDGFEPGLLRFEWFEYREDLADRLVALAEGFLRELDEAAQMDDQALVYDDRLDTLAVNVLKFRDAESSAKQAKEAVWGDLKAAVAHREGFSQESTLVRVTWSPGAETESTGPDVEAAKEADPDLFAEVQALSKRWNAHQKKYQKSTVKTTAGSLTVTSVKGQGNE